MSVNKDSLLQFLQARMTHYEHLSTPHGVGFAEGCVEAFEETIEEIELGKFNKTEEQGE